MLIVPYVIVIFYILFFKRTEKSTWVLAASLMAFLSATSTSYADLINYVPLFEYVNYVELPVAAQTTGVIWACLNKLFYFLGFNYRGMVVVMLFLDYYLMHNAVRRLGGNENLYFGLFLIFPSIIQLVQFKFFTAFCVVFVGYSILVTSEKLSRVKYLGFIAIAFLIHTSCVMFLLLLLVKMKHYDRKRFVLITAGLTLFMVIFLNPIVSIVSRYLNPRLSARYLTDSITPSSLTWIVLIFIVWLVSYILSSYLLSNRAFEGTTITSDDSSFYVANYNGMAIEILLLTLPFLLLDSNYHRFLEMGYSILFVVAGMYITPPRYSRNKMIFILVLMVLLVIISYIYCPYETVLKPVFMFDGFVNVRR